MNREKRILLVEDDAELRALLAQLLRLDGYEVTLLSSGSEFLAWVDARIGRRDDDTPDLILSDIRMPGFSGLVVLDYMRTVGDRTPVILMTAFGDLETHRSAARLGAAMTIDKPFEPDDLLQAVRALI